MFKLVRYFYLVAAAIVLLVIVVVLGLFRQNEVRELVQVGEENNVALVQMMANIVWPRFADYLQGATEPDGIRDPETEIHRELHGIIESLIVGIPIYQVRIFNLDGVVVFSEPHPPSGSHIQWGEGFRTALDEGVPVSELIRKGDPSRFENELVAVDTVESFVPVAGVDGSILGVFEVHTDISEEILRVQRNTTQLGSVLSGMLFLFYVVLFLVVRRVENALKSQYDVLLSSERRLHHLLETCPVGVAVSSFEGETMLVNSRLASMLRTSVDELLKRTPRDMFEDTRDYESLITRLHQADAFHDMESRLRRDDGGICWAHVSVELSDFHDKPAVVNWAHDITKRKEAEKTLEEGERTLLNVIEASPVAVGISDKDGRFLFWNPLFFRIGQQLPDETGAINFRLVYVDPEMRSQLLADLDADGLIEHREVEIALGDGTTAWSLMSMQRMEFEGQISVLTWVYDITNLKLQEEALTQARIEAEEASRAKSDFLATMSHEIRTPMNGVVTMSEMLDQTALSSEQKDMTSVIRDSASALLTIIDEILDFSRIEAGKLSLETVSLSLAQVVEGVADLLGPRAGEKGLELITYIDPSLPDHLRGDPVRLRQILVNLVGNALKFTEVGHISVDVLPATPMDSRVKEGPVSILVRITDTGIGIAEEQIDKLFQPFSQADTSTVRRFGGTGLGLSICRALVDMMGGSLGVESTLGSGSVFWFQVPLTALTERRIRFHGDMSTSHILVATASPPFGETAARYLGCHKARVSVTATAGDTLAVLRNSLGSSDEVRVVLVDEDLADVEGRALARAIRADERLRDIRIVLMLPKSAVASSVQSADRYAFAKLIKPVKREVFCRTVAAAAGLVSLEDEGLPGRRSCDPPEQRDYVAPSIAEALAADALVLVAEDNPTNQTVIKMLLERLGYACELAVNGAEAWRMLEAGRYGLLLTDCHMPEMDGYQLAERLRQHEEGTDRHLPVVALTADALIGTSEKCRLAGMDDYLKKPVSRVELEKALLRWLPVGEELRRPARQVVDDISEVSLPTGGTPRPQVLDAVEPSAPAPAPEPEEAGDVPEEVLAQPVLDLDYLRNELGITDDMMAAILADFLETTRPNVDGMRDGLTLGEWEKARKQAHAAAGACKTAGARRLAVLCSDVEKAIVEQDTSRARSLGAHADALFAEVAEAITSS